MVAGSESMADPEHNHMVNFATTWPDKAADSVVVRGERGERD